MPVPTRRRHRVFSMVGFVLLALTVVVAPGLGIDPGEAIADAPGSNGLLIIAGARLERDAAGRATAVFSRDHGSYQIDRLSDGTVIISDIQSHRFSDLRVRDVVMLRFKDGWSYDLATGRLMDNNLGAASTAPVNNAPINGDRVLRVCPEPGRNCDTTLTDGLSRAAAGSVVTLASGTYREAGILTANNVTLRAEVGARVVGVAADGKAALVIRGNGTVVEGLECSGIAVPDHNGACIRLEGRNLTVRRVHFHDAEEGMLIGDQGGTVVIEDSRFERLGATGRAHGVYANHIQELTIRRSCFLSSRDQGHEVKSRALRTVIENSIIASLDGFDSRLIDIPNGGDLIIRNSILEKGPGSSNPDTIGAGLEGITWPVSRVHLENSIVIFDRPEAILINGSASTTFSGARMVGGGRQPPPEVGWLPNREAARLPSYPDSLESLVDAQEKLLKLPRAALAGCLGPTTSAGTQRSALAPSLPTASGPQATGNTAFSPAVAAPSAADELVGLKLIEQHRDGRQSQVVTFGQVFAPGAVHPADQISARSQGLTIPVQMDVKTTHGDGSVRHAILTFGAPALRAGAVQDFMLVRAARTGDALMPPLALTPDEGGVVVQLDFKDGTSVRLDTADLLRKALAAGTLDDWLDGPLAHEVRVGAPVTPYLRATFDLRRTADGRRRTGITLSNDATWTPGLHTADYVVTIENEGRKVFTAALSHYRNANWHKVVWSGGDPDLRVVHDIDALIRSGAIPAFDTTLGVDLATLADVDRRLARSNTGPLGDAFITHYMPTTGGRADIGIVPDWTARYLISQDPRAEAAMLANADASGSIPWHFHDEATGQWVRIDQHPRLWLDERAKAPNHEPPATPLNGADKDTGWTPDNAHTPSLTFIPYLMTGERYYLDECQAEAAWLLAVLDPNYRTRVGFDQVRAQAWGLRDIGNTAYATPDRDPLKSYFTAEINSRLDLLRTEYLVHQSMQSAGEVEGWFRGDSSRAEGTIGPWQNDFMVIALGELVGQGFDQARSLLAWTTHFTAGRFISGDQGFAPFAGPAYRLMVFDPVTMTPLPTWRQVFAASFPSASQPTNFPQESYPACAFCYVANAKAALATAITITRSVEAMKAYAFLVAHTPQEALAEYRKQPNWAIRPALASGRYLSLADTAGARALGE